MEIERVKNYRQLKKILGNSNWQRFEEIVGKVLELNGYEVDVSKVITFDKTKRQYDVIAKKDHKIIIDCKKWDKKRRIKHGLKKAVEDQIKRVKKLDYEEAYPMVVVSCNSPVEYYKEVPVIPVSRLNRFILNFPKNKEKILRL